MTNELDLDAIKQLHQTDYESIGGCVCGEAYPCTTLMLIAEVERLRERVTTLEGGIRELHYPVDDGMGFGPDGYGAISPACPTCGTHYEYAVAWPCQTASLLDVSHDQESK